MFKRRLNNKEYFWAGVHWYEVETNNEAPQDIAQKLNEAFPESSLWRLAKKYAGDPHGIRNEERLCDICLQCGSRAGDKSPQEPSFKVCPNCHNEWYTNHCWNCKEGRVDSRDPETPQCPACGWYKCACGACHMDGCKTNPYSRDNRLRDRRRFTVHKQIAPTPSNTTSGDEESPF